MVIVVIEAAVGALIVAVLWTLVLRRRRHLDDGPNDGTGPGRPGS